MSELIGASQASVVLHWYRLPALSEFQIKDILQAFPFLRSVDTETCFNVLVEKNPLSAKEADVLTYLLRETFEPHLFSDKSFLASKLSQQLQHQGQETAALLEVGPRLNFSTAWSSNAVAICRACGISSITRVERSRRLLLVAAPNHKITQQEISAILASGLIHDRMTECHYPKELTSFETGVKPAAVYSVPVMAQGSAALQAVNKQLGLGFDDQDIAYYTELFMKRIGRDPTIVELFDIGQSNSEHSRHWFFGGKLVIDGKPMQDTLFQLVKRPWELHKGNSTIAFCDNSSAIEGYDITLLAPQASAAAGVTVKAGPHPAVLPAPLAERKVNYDLTFTAETHNFPSGVAPFPGAETGTGGRIRDGHATGRGSLVVAGTAGYCVGNLRIPGYGAHMPWETSSFNYPSNLASPLSILVQASNGASDYGNKFGEPLIQGFTRSFGMRLPNGERREWLKPIMFTGGVGQMDSTHRKKGAPEKGMAVIKLGGPAYRIGMGGGAASSMTQGDNEAELDFNAVQRGDAEMEQKVNRVIRACVEMGDQNPIISIHDQGAGGNGNVLKEIVDPAGAVIEIRNLLVGDKTLSVLELWGAEYQENDALLIKQEHVDLFTALCEREKTPFAVVGTVTDTGKVVVHDANDDTTPVDLELSVVLGKLPQKTFHVQSVPPVARALALPAQLPAAAALDRVLRLVSVGSKRFLTNKVDRSVTGLIAQQQCVGPLHIPISDVAVVAQSYLGVTGVATSIGEQPLKGLINAASMARMTVAEALTNMCFARVSSIENIRASGNWMWAAKQPGEGAEIYAAAVAASEALVQLGVAIDGGKDSLSMAARCKSEVSQNMEVVKAPGQFVLSCYCSVPDITLTVTPDLKLKGQGVLLLVELFDSASLGRLGGSALAQVFEQIGQLSPDVAVADGSMAKLKALFNTMQLLLSKKLISAGHDRSDGGLLVTVLEMAFAGNCGVELKLPEVKAGAGNDQCDPVLSALFNEECGVVLEVEADHVKEVMAAFHAAGVIAHEIGHVRSDFTVDVSVGGRHVLSADMRDLRDTWEATSFALELRQANPICVASEQKSLRKRTGPQFKCSFDMSMSPSLPLNASKPRVAVIRQEGSNGDREMLAAFHLAGFEAWDVHMSDLASGHIDLSPFRGVAFVGGFSYGDVMDSAKGWAGVIKFHPELTAMFRAFVQRSDTFSLGVCNGCQLMALLGWVPFAGTSDALQPRFVHNASGRFESRFSTLLINKSPAVMLRGMEGSVLGTWVAHGEGRAYFPDANMLTKAIADGLAPIRYVDDASQPTEEYPFNPNGSPHGIAALCSPDGRHLAIMPHPERSILKWQWPHLPAEWRIKQAVKTPSDLHSPWLRMFQNARDWCVNPSK